MTQLSNAELASLKARCQVAARRGFAVGQSVHYARLLAAETKEAVVPNGMTNGSPQHLLYLCKKAEDKRAGKKSSPKAAKPVAPPPPKPVAPPPPKEEKVEVKEAVDVASEFVLPSAKELDGMTKAELYDVAQAIDLEGRSGLDKDELLAALKRFKG